jgi:hypothetical protein
MLVQVKRQLCLLSFWCRPEARGELPVHEAHWAPGNLSEEPLQQVANSGQSGMMHRSHRIFYIKRDPFLAPPGASHVRQRGGVVTVSSPLSILASRPVTH